MTRTACPLAFDHNSIDDPAAVYAELRDAAPVSWADSNGGYWVVSGYAEVSEALAHPEIFSSALATGPGGEPVGGIFIPAEKALVPMIPTEVDPPEWRDYRMLLTRQFSPSAVKAMRPRISDLAARYIDRLSATGSCDMVNDIAAPIPASVTLALLGLDVDQWAVYAEPFHNALGYPPGSAEFDRAIEGLHEIVDRIRVLVPERRGNPGDDLISTVVGADIHGQPISEQNAIAVVYSVFSGGVDTTTSYLANVFAYLSQHHDARRFLIDDPSKIRLATEEFMRWTSPLQALGRTVTRRTTLGGQAMEPGERVLIAYASANRDDTVFQDPNTCVLACWIAIPIATWPSAAASTGVSGPIWPEPRSRSSWSGCSRGCPTSRSASRRVINIPTSGSSTAGCRCRPRSPPRPPKQAGAESQW